jgi:uncharacterized protein YjbI with pentapeptide repeats
MNDNNAQDDLKQLRGWLFTFGILFIFVFLVVGILLWAINVVPIRDSFSILEPKEYFELRDKGIKSVIEGLKVLATIFGGIAILGNLFYAAKRAKALDASAIAANATAKAALENAKAALKNAEAAQDKQITERFTKAVEQLASSEIAIRLGGIYSLERIAKNSEDDHWTIMKVLTAFVRENASVKTPSDDKRSLIRSLSALPKPRIDIQAALTVIGQRHWVDPKNLQWLDLNNTDLRRAYLRKANLKGADFNEANLQGADLIRANLQRAEFLRADLQLANLLAAELQEAILIQASLQQTTLNDANLQRANAQSANLQRASLARANLQWAFLREANLQEAFLQTANLRGIDLKEAKLQRANLDGADLTEAKLDRAKLEGANLNGAKNLKQEQIDKAFGDMSTTRLPEHLKAPIHWIKSK